MTSASVVIIISYLGVMWRSSFSHTRHLFLLGSSSRQDRQFDDPESSIKGRFSLKLFELTLCAGTFCVAPGGPTMKCTSAMCSLLNITAFLNGGVRIFCNNNNKKKKSELRINAARS